jgi:hypothetical protein
MKTMTVLMLLMSAAACMAEDLAPVDIYYTYDPGQRRDPFAPHRVSGPEVPRGALAVNNIVLVGIVRSAGGYTALVQGPDRKARSLRAGDELYDALVLSVEPEEMVLRQDVRVLDPSSTVRYREVKKSLHPEDE